MAESSRAPWIVAGVLLVLGAGAALWFLRPPPPPGERPGRPEDPEAVSVDLPLNRADSQKLVEQRNLGLAYLENHQFDDAIKTFEKILATLPNEPFALRNLAISRVKYAVEKIDDRIDPQAFAQAMEAGRSAVQTLEELDPESAFPHFLRAVLATKAGDPKEIARHLQAATERDPDNAAWKFQWFELGRSMRDPVEKQAAFHAGQSAAALAPENLFVQKEVLAENLSVLVDLAKTSPDEAASQVDALLLRLENLREPLQVLGISIQVQAKVDVVAVLDVVLAALHEKNFQQARNEFFKIKNLLSQETASDADLIHPHPLTYHDLLNYVALDFSPAFYRRADLPDDTLPQIDVQWTTAQEVLPELDPDTVALQWLDVDLDGTDDVVGLGSRHFTTYLRHPERTGWEASGIEHSGGYGQFTFADLDDDVMDLHSDQPGELGPVDAERCHEADPDFVLYGPSGILLINNRYDPATKTRHLEPLPGQTSGFGELKEVTQTRLVDFDHDGDLDLVTISQGKLGLWINRGNFEFTSVVDRSLMPPEEFQVTAFAAVDWDRDNDVDLLLSGEKTAGWMENLRHGRMRFHLSDSDWAEASQLQVTELDGDGNWDLVVSENETIKVLFTSTPLAGFPTIDRQLVVFNAPFQQVELADFDNDGGTDLLVTRDATATLLRNLGSRAFEEQPQFSDVIPTGTVNLAFGDADADGDLDVICRGQKTSLLTNDGGNQNHSLTVKFRGQQVKANEQGASRRVNHYGVGNTVEVKVGNRYQARIAEGQSTRFGIGPADKADIVRVIATNGVPQNRIEPKANELICERQVLQTSCPYLFTWSGSRYEFVTDLIWASPLGLNATQRELMPWRAWENLKIDGRFLQPVDGEYRMQITEELWEAAYFEQVQLIAVDHPADVDIYTNEKVGSEELAAHRIHTVSEPLRLEAVHDQAGRDWSSHLAERDETYTRNFEEKLAQGLCREHYLEFHLGDLKSSRQITLFLTGWIRPTDTNINVALDQNPDLPSPTGLALWTPDASGNWREISPHVGFPNGKTKTIAIDVSEAFSPGDYRMRLVTNREFYWDQAFFTVDEEPVEIRETILPMLRADLHDRGVSRGVLPAGDGPETYDYDELAQLPPWPDMGGLFTRYGDVLPLLAREDDRMVVLGAGDEISLAFGVPAEPLPDGWVRDFVLHNVGWVKDCHLNTWEGERVEPLPFLAMREHDYWTGRPEETSDYADYLRTYQTRRQRSGYRPFVRHWTPAMKQALAPWERDRRNGD